VNEAYNALSDEFKKANYDNIIFGEIAPVRAHNIFEDFFGNRWFNLDDDDFKPIFHNKWIKNLDKMMIDEDEENAKEGETIKTSSYWTNKNGQETGKTVTTKKTVKDGKAN
jgi:DnaJ-class molecular chaperone